MIRRSVFIALLLAGAAAGAQESNPAASAAAAAEPKVQVIDHKIGTGKEAAPGSTVRVNYTGWFYKPLTLNHHGRKFDSSLDPGREPIEFRLGSGMVIKGWEQGIAGMKVGGKRTLVIPSELAYGQRGAGDGAIPPDSDLIFDVELVGVK